MFGVRVTFEEGRVIEASFFLINVCLLRAGWLFCSENTLGSDGIHVLGSDLITESDVSPTHAANRPVAASVSIVTINKGGIFDLMGHVSRES
jgi:hypothetical protein